MSHTARTFRINGPVGVAVLFFLTCHAHPGSVSYADQEVIPAPRRFEKPPTIRVRLAEVSATPQLVSAGACRILPHSGSGRRLIPRLGPVKVRLKPEGIALGSAVFKCKTLDIKPEGANMIEVDGRAYFGTIQIVRSGNRILVINLIDLEQYLLGVLGGEMPAKWPLEALKAQAVAARTYAFYFQQERSPTAGRKTSPPVKRENRHGSSAPPAPAVTLWDVTSTVEDQVYQGGKPPQRVREAVTGTRGQVLLHNNGLFPAFFHSTCGGKTENPGTAFGKPEFDFIEGVACRFCKSSHHYQWKAEITGSELALKLKAGGIRINGPIVAVSLVEPEGDAGTCRMVKIVCAKDEKLISVVDFRRAVGRMKIKSGKFECTARDGTFMFAGRGLGHGAGMCQYGARGMANAGHTYDRILLHYYRNAKIEKLYD